MLHVRLFLLCWLVALGCARAQANNATEDYDSLSRLSSARLMQSGRHHFEQRQGSKALACFSIVAERYKQNDAEAELSIRALNNCACVYKYFFLDYLQAYDYFTRAYDLCEQEHLDEFLPVIMVNLGDLLNDYGVSYSSEPLARQARQLFEQSMDRAVETANWELMTTAFFNLANQNYQLQLAPYRDALFSPAIPDSTPDLAYVRLQYQGLEAVQQHRYAEARDYFGRQLAVVSARWEPERDTLATYMSLAHTYLCENNAQQAAEHLQQALQLATDKGVGDQDAAICQLLAQCYEQMGRTDMQQHYRQLYLEKKEEAHANRLVNIGELAYIHQLQKEQDRARQLAQRQQLQQLCLLAVGLVLLVVLLSALLLWRKNRQLSQAYATLYEKAQQLQKAERENQQLMKYNRSNLSDEQKATLIFRIQDLLADSSIVCQQDFSLAKLAKLADTNTTYASQVVNEKYGTAFSNVLAACRVREACRRMSEESEHYSHITIEAIATSVGFKSRTSFINAFKREVGLTPSEYLRMALNKK